MWARAHMRGMALSALSPQHFTEPNSDEMRPSYGPLKSGIGRAPRPAEAREKAAPRPSRAPKLLHYAHHAHNAIVVRR